MARPHCRRRAGRHDARPHADLARCALPAGRAQSLDDAASEDGHHQRPLDGTVPPTGPGRQVARRRVPEENNFDISWITSLARENGGRELHRFRYPSVVEKRAEIRAKNDGAQPREPAMRVSQVMIEPVLRDAIVDDPLVEARWGVAFEDFSQDGQGVHLHPARRRDRPDRAGALRLPGRLRRRLESRTRQARDRARGQGGRRPPLHDPFPVRRAGRPAGLRRRVALPDRQGHLDRPGRQGHLDPADAHARRRQARSGRDARRVGRPLVRTQDPGRQSVVHAPAAGRPLLGRARLPRGRCSAPVHPDRRLRDEHRHLGTPSISDGARRDAERPSRPGPAGLLRTRAPPRGLAQPAGLRAPHRRAPQDRRALPGDRRSRRPRPGDRRTRQRRERELGPGVRLSL